MALQQGECHVLAFVEESTLPIVVPEGDSTTSVVVIVAPEEEQLQTTFTMLPKHQTDLSDQHVSEYIRQESSLSADSIPEEDENDADESSSDGGLELGPRGQRRSASVVSDASEEGGRDSGIEAEKDPDMVVPDQDLIDRIVTQVEIYFSDASVLKDKFLLKHIRRNKEGYVSLKLVSSFKKIKQLTKDWRVVAFALNKASIEIQINDLGTKIRRITPLPEIDETPVTCTILALNLPLEKPGIDTVSQLFGQCGDIALIRVLRAGSPLSTELKPLASKYPCLNTTHCAWIEFESTDAVKEACKLSSDEGMKVVPIVSETGKKSEKPTQQKSQPSSRKNSTNANQTNNNNINNINNNNIQQRSPTYRKTSFKYNNMNNLNNKYNNEYNNPQPQQLQQQYSRHPAGPQRRKAISLFHNNRPNLGDLTVIVEGRRRPKSKSCIEFPGQGSSSPTSSSATAAASSWVQRHLFAAAVASAASAASPTVKTQRPSRVSLGTLTLPDGVARFPKGPDGSKGFGGRRASEACGPAPAAPSFAVDEAAK